MLCLDHLTIIAPSLAEGVDHVRACLDLDIPYGGTHPEMGTHNHVLRLGEGAYLEVIAVDPSAPAPSGPRWFGLGNPEAVRSDWANGRRLRGWVARTDDIDTILIAHGNLLGSAIRVSRGGKHSRFSLPADGSLPLGGALPSVIDRSGRSPPPTRMQDLGAHLREFVLEHPDPDLVTALYNDIGIENSPLVQQGARVRYSATVDTLSGVKTLY